MENIGAYQQKTKVLGYIIREINDSQYLLIFAHKDFPNAGLQVPGGTLEDGESLKAGILREVKEESGLTAFSAVRYLGKSVYVTRSKREIHNRHFFQLNHKGQMVADFFHEVSHGKEDKGLIFHYHWVPLNNLPPLAVNQDVMIPLIE